MIDDEKGGGHALAGTEGGLALCAFLSASVYRTVSARLEAATGAPDEGLRPLIRDTIYTTLVAFLQHEQHERALRYLERLAPDVSADKRPPRLLEEF